MKRRVVIDADGVALDGHQIELSGHAVDAYQKRFRPSLRHQHAREDLEARIRRDGRFQETRPHWLAGVTNQADAYVVLDDDLAVPLRWHRTKPGVLIAPTVLYRS